VLVGRYRPYTFHPSKLGFPLLASGFFIQGRLMRSAWGNAGCRMH
jgi:hypothetical protein